MSYAQQLTIYVAEGERSQGKLLYQALMDAARQSGIVGMTVMRSAVGYGQRHRHISVDWIMELAPELIMILTVIDEPGAIAQFISHVRALVQYGVATQETVRVVHHVPVAEDAPIQPLAQEILFTNREAAMTDFERLTIYVGESDRWNGKPVHLALVEEARRQGLIGATVVRGVTGYGKHNQHRVMLLGIIELSSDLPMVATVIDRKEKIEQFLPLVQEMVVGGIVVRGPIDVVHHTPLNESN
jgi:PII-like signaling protein